jgi:hypothetical protein
VRTVQNIQIYIYINSVLTSQETHYFSATEPNQLMLFGVRVAVYCENHTEHTAALYEQNAEFYYVKVGNTYIDHKVLFYFFLFSFFFREGFD